MEPVTPTLPDDDVAAIDRLGAIYKELSSELSKMIIGQQRVVELLSIALFSRGHALLMGVPGLAKTLLVSSVAKTLDLSFNRIQFTPDLMPADITGTDIIQDDSAGGKRQFEFIKGPVFANIVLADEINRAPAKTQSALLDHYGTLCPFLRRGTCTYEKTGRICCSLSSVQYQPFLWHCPCKALPGSRTSHRTWQ